jgi:hypothetical protein
MSDPGTFLLKLIVTVVMAAAISAALHATQAAAPAGIAASDTADNLAVLSGTASEEGSCVLQHLLGFSC